MTNLDTLRVLLIRTRGFELDIDRLGVYLRVGRRDWYWQRSK
jgi:hypothetical protein